MSFLKTQSKIKIQQMKSTLYPNRGLKFDFDFVRQFTSRNTWTTLSDQAKLMLPKKINLVDGGTKAPLTFDGKSLVSGKDPILMRGDKIQIDLGYSNVAPIENVFSGYISAINVGSNYEIECQDATYLLKKINAPNKTFLSDKYTTKTMIRELIPTSIPINLDGVAKIQISDFTTNNETVAQILQRLEQDFKLKVYVRESNKGAFLYVNFFAYLPQDWMNPFTKDYDIFQFNYNIINSDLTFKTVEDTRVGLKCKSVFKVPQGKKNTLKILNTFVYYDRSNNLKSLETAPSDFNGEIRTYFSYNAKTEADLIKEAKYQIDHIVWDGYKGTFKTFGIPLVKFGRCIEIRDAKLPERNGFYLVKSVQYSFGMDGFKQIIEIDFKVGTDKSKVETMQNKLSANLDGL